MGTARIARPDVSEVFAGSLSEESASRAVFSRLYSSIVSSKLVITSTALGISALPRDSESGELTRCNSEGVDTSVQQYGRAKVAEQDILAQILSSGTDAIDPREEKVRKNY